MNRNRWTIIFLTIIALLGLFLYSLTQKEELLANGKTVFLKLAPVDPRSIMQGDYMTLAVDEINKNQDKAKTKQGYFIAKLDTKSVGIFVRWQTSLIPLSENEIAIHYNKDFSGSIKIGAESYFFEEGQGSKFDKATHAGIKVDGKGHAVLEGLYNDGLVKIQ